MKDVSSRVLADLLRTQPLTPAKVRFAWENAAGPALARATTVELDARGALIVRASTPAWEHEVKRSRYVLLERLRRLLGDDVVTGMRVRVS